MIPITPWFERRFEFDFPVGLFPVIYSRLEGSIYRLSALLHHADDDACSKAQKGWSVKQQVGHLYDLEALWWQRLEDYRQGKEQLTAADITNRKTTEAPHNSKSLTALVNQFADERGKMLENIYSFDEDTLLLTAIHPRLQQPMRVVDALFFVAEHDDHHIAIITQLLQEQQSHKG
ncbi:MAG: DinB family protein [Flavisolibacter sp.]|nr:DinB family protein [Flavisolibacter sp.]